MKSEKCEEIVDTGGKCPECGAELEHTGVLASCGFSKCS